MTSEVAAASTTAKATTMKKGWRSRLSLCMTTSLIAVVAYWDETALRGNFIYDDVASILNNPLVMDAVNTPASEVWSRDFWGNPMDTARSHKSFRPLTTLTLRWNMMYAQRQGLVDTPDYTFHFHVVNVILHGINTGLVTETAAVVFGHHTTILSPFIAGVVFGIHPVHAEAVSNITSRGELLMTFFFLLAFLSYAHTISSPIEYYKVNKIKKEDDDDDKDDNSQNDQDPTQQMDANSLRNRKGNQPTTDTDNSTTTPKDKVAPTKASSERKVPPLYLLIRVYILPWLCMALSLFSKEQGITTLCTLVAYDFIQHQSDIQSFLQKLQSGDDYTWQFLRRTLILATQTIIMVALRVWLNGETSPDFVVEQNPQGFATDRFTRIFSVNWTYCLYLRDMVYPRYLAPDWSGFGIPLIESWDDPRVLGVVALWVGALATIRSLVVGVRANTSRSESIKRKIVLHLIGFGFLPFLLSSNLLVTTGLAKADRILYLPLLGYCLLQGLMVQMLGNNASLSSWTFLSFVLGGILVLQFGWFWVSVQERNVAWASDYDLWTKAYAVNPRSFHTKSNAGRVLAKNGEYVKAEEVLRPLADCRAIEGDATDTFLYAVSLSKLKRCPEALALVEDTTKYLYELREQGGKRHDPKMSLHAESSLMIARAFCEDSMLKKGKIMEEAITLDPNNSFAMSQFQSYVQTVQGMRQNMERIGIPQNQQFFMLLQGKPLTKQQTLMIQRLEQTQSGKPLSQEQLELLHEIYVQQGGNVPLSSQQLQNLHDHPNHLLSAEQIAVLQEGLTAFQLMEKENRT